MNFVFTDMSFLNTCPNEMRIELLEHGRVLSDSAVSLLINMLTGVIVPKARKVILYARYVRWTTRYFTFYVYIVLLSVMYDLMRSLL
jgi:hypothetical protein